jgi:hypothetical protein
MADPASLLPLASFFLRRFRVIQGERCRFWHVEFRRRPIKILIGYREGYCRDVISINRFRTRLKARLRRMRSRKRRKWRAGEQCGRHSCRTRVQLILDGG